LEVEVATFVVGGAVVFEAKGAAGVIRYSLEEFATNKLGIPLTPSDAKDFAKALKDGAKTLASTASKNAKEAWEKLKKAAVSSRTDEVASRGGMDFIHATGVSLGEYSISRILVDQMEGGSCVGSCGKMLLADKGIDIPEAYIRNMLGIDASGTSVRNLQKLVDEMPELSGATVRANAAVSDVVELAANGPVAVNITHSTYGSHAVIVDGIQDGRVLIRDPLPEGLGSSYSMDLADFEGLFGGSIVALH
jgi:hypothetical protein